MGARATYSEPSSMTASAAGICAAAAIDAPASARAKPWRFRERNGGLTPRYGDRLEAPRGSAAQNSTRRERHTACVPNCVRPGRDGRGKGVTELAGESAKGQQNEKDRDRT
jgi:hypothetical protein